MSLMSGSEYSATRGASAVPPTCTPTRMSRLGRTASRSSDGLSSAPVKVMSPRSISSFWP